MATTEIILREKVENVGSEADVVTVKAGFARNYLIPQGKAYEATKGNLRHLEALAASRVKREADELASATTVSNRINKARPKFKLEIGQGGKAFGSVTSMDIHQKLLDAGITIDRHAIKLDKPIKTTGRTDVEIRLLANVTATLRVMVEADEEAGAAKA